MNQMKNADTWQPSPTVIAGAKITALIQALGLKDYDDLLRYAIEHPAEYWAKVLSFLDFRWSKQPSAHVNLDRGPEFPEWFPGGELNWVENILKFGEAPASADRIALIAERENGNTAQVTFSQLRAQVIGLAAGLKNAGVNKGDRIGLFTENGIEATVTLLAISYIGAIVVPLFSGFGADAIASRLGSCGARGLVASTGFERRGRSIDTRATVRDALRQLPEIDLLVWKQPGGTAAPEEGLDWHALLAFGGEAPAPEIMSANDPFMVIYTSGTTGKPKGTVHTHGSFPIKIAHDSAIHFDIGEGDVLCWPADMGWIAGALILSAALLRGATLVCYDGAPDFPDWSRLSKLVERHRVTHLGSAPTLIRGLAANTPLSTSGDTSTLKVLITAGEGIDPDHFLWFRRNFGSGDRPLINYTGGTEVSGALLSSVIIRPIAPAAFNTKSPGVAVDVVDVNGAPVTAQIGELAILSPFIGMTRSFWNDDERYLESYWQSVPGMWIHGDLALRDANGSYFILGRSDDTIKVAGKRLGPAEVEELILELPDISEAAAIGVDDPVKGQRLVVFIIPSPSWDKDEDGLAATIRKQVGDQLGKPFSPSAVHIVFQLPKTRSSKVMRRLIRSVYCDLPLGDLSSLDNPDALDTIRQLVHA